MLRGTGLLRLLLRSLGVALIFRQLRQPADEADHRDEDEKEDLFHADLADLGAGGGR